jgi:hypothetical protein
MMGTVLSVQPLATTMISVISTKRVCCASSASSSRPMFASSLYAVTPTLQRSRGWLCSKPTSNRNAVTRL